jgi:hypothetical protein
MSADQILQLLARCRGPDPDPWGFNRSRSARTVPAPLPTRTQVPPPTPTTRGGWRCTAHGTLTREPSTCQCGPRFRFFDPTVLLPLEPPPRCPLTLKDAVRAEGLSEPVVSPAPCLPLARRLRDARGRFVRDAGEPGPVPSDERMTDDKRATLRAAYYQGKAGSRKPLAAVCGVGAETLRRYLARRITVPDACERRMARVASRIKRGELVCRELCPGVAPRTMWREGKPSHTWEYHPPKRVPKEQEPPRV